MGIGPEIVDATCYILEKDRFDLEIIPTTYKGVLLVKLIIHPISYVNKT